ncbi:MAG: AAA family ATPase [Mycolicibacterium neoaurum]|uniref:AAA family ATPase n=1 Tax=Mycolicibacterium neoaurum TaxID=1795 RepID=UPI002FF9C091
MLLKSARVQDYRSIHDSGIVEFEENKTLLVGVNEAGKTAFLKALQQINPPSGTEPFNALRDYPRSRYNEIQRHERDPSDITVVWAEFTLTPDDLAAVLEASPQSSDVTTYHIARQLDGSWQWTFPDAKMFATFAEVESDLARLRAHIAKAEGSEPVVAALDELTKVVKPASIMRGVRAGNFLDWLTTALPLIDESNSTEENRYQRLRKAISYGDDVTAAGHAVQQRLPTFVYYSTYFSVRPRINLASLALREASGDIEDDFDFANLCLLRLLGFTARELSELAAGEPKPENYDGGAANPEYLRASQNHQDKLDDRHYRLNAGSVELTRAVREVWGDERVTLDLVADGQYLKAVVVDDIGVNVELDQRSEGFRWLVSFFIVFKSQTQGDLKNAILLLDEPGLSLHALKQQEFRNTVTRLAEDNQVVYTTHSPFMVGSDELDLVRIVEMVSRESGTKIHTRVAVDDPRSIYPLQAALGYELAQSLFGQRRNLVCEGLTDMMYIEALNTAFGESGQGFKNEVALVPASSASKVIYYSTVLVSQNLKVAALLDSDSAGDTAAKQEELIHMLTQKRILRTKDYTAAAGGKPEIEDLLRATLVKVAKDELNWDVTETEAAQPNRRLIDIFKAEIAGFSKYKLARAFIRWIGMHDTADLTEDERAAAIKLFSDVNKALA